MSDLGVFDFKGPGGTMQIVSLHPGVDFATVQEKTGFELPNPGANVAVTAAPTAEELRVIRDVIDPLGLRRLDSAEGGTKLTLELWEQDLAAGKARASKAA